jgi:hypothetical protein
MVFRLKNISRTEYLVCSVIWFFHYFYILVFAALEVHEKCKDRFVARKLLAPGWIPNLGIPYLSDFEIFSHRDKMDSEWTQFLSAAPLMFGNGFQKF